MSFSPEPQPLWGWISQLESPGVRLYWLALAHVHTCACTHVYPGIRDWGRGTLLPYWSDMVSTPRKEVA